LKVVVRQKRLEGPPLHGLFSSNPSDKNFNIAILLKIVQRSYNENSGVNTTPQGPRAGVVSYALGSYMVPMEGTLVKTSKRAHLTEN
jgi:hypothetical protein